MTTVYALYFNSLGSGRPRQRERLAMRYLHKHGIEAEHVPIDWYSDEPFAELLERMVALVTNRLEVHGKLVLIGSSAGGSLAVNTFSRLQSDSLYVVTLCSRLREANLPWWDVRSLERMAHLHTRRPSQTFFDSVMYCSRGAIEQIHSDNVRHVMTIRQWADDVVPRATMNIPGVTRLTVPGIGRGMGIAMGVRALPSAIESLCHISG